MDQVEVEGLRIAYERVGDGPPVVLVHGFVGDGRSVWSGQLTALRDEFTVVAWDGPGAGRSDDPPPHFRLPDFARCLAGFVDELGLDRPHMVGLSFGGAMLIELFGLRPAMPRSLVLAGAYAGWSGSLGADAARERLRSCERVAQLSGDAFAEAMVPSMFSESAPADVVTQIADSARAFSPAGFVTMSRASAEADLRSVLPDIVVPTLLLYGDRDIRAPLNVARDLRDAIPGSRLAIMAGVGHVSSVEAPEMFNAELLGFLRSLEAA